MAGSLVSIIVPTYNRAYCLAATLDSAFSQTHKNIELILIDDGSTDGTADLIAQRYAGEKRLRYVTQANAGVASARNHGLKLAQGDFIALLDSDDLWHPWKLEAQLAIMNAHPFIGMVWTDMEAINDKGEIFAPTYLRTMYSAYRWFSTPEAIFSHSDRLAGLAPQLQEMLGETRVYHGDIFGPMILGSLVHTSTVLLRRERFEQVGLFREEFTPAGEDYDFHLRTCRAGKVAFLNASSIVYQVGRPDQITRPELKLIIAINSLKAIENFLQTERQLINLPNWMIRATLAISHYCIGEHSLTAGKHRQAFRHFLLSLRYKLWQPRIFAFLPMAFLPLRLTEGLRATYRQIKGTAKPSSR